MGSTQLAVNEKGLRTRCLSYYARREIYISFSNFPRGTVPSTHILMHGLGPNLPPPPIAHDHGAALDHASHGEYHPTSSGNPGTKLIHTLVEALSNRAQSNLSAADSQGFDTSIPLVSGSGSTPERMPEVSDLQELKSRLCLREGLNHDECERALLPTLEHASMVHSHIHHFSSDQSEEAFVQTRNAIVYISVGFHKYFIHLYV